MNRWVGLLLFIGCGADEPSTSHVDPVCDIRDFAPGTCDEVSGFYPAFGLR